MTLPYRILLIVLLLTGFAFSQGPWLTMHAIRQAAKADDKDQWQTLVKPEGLSGHVEQMVSGLSELSMQAGIAGKTDLYAAAVEYEAGKKGGIVRVAQQLTSPQGFSHLLCGVVLSEPNAQPDGTTGCWALEGKLTWQSPTQAKVTFINPETQWQSSLILARVGLFTWQAVGLELPDQAIVDHYAKAIGLDKAPIKREQAPHNHEHDAAILHPA